MSCCLEDHECEECCLCGTFDEEEGSEVEQYHYRKVTKAPRLAVKEIASA